MKRLLVGLVLASAAVAGPALAGVGFSIDIGEPGFYGQLDVGGGYQPRVLYSRPVIVERGARALSPVYLRVPAGQERNWSNYCGRYQACDRPVYFVRDDWYRNEYAPRYRREHARDWRNDRRDERQDRRDDRRDNRYDQRHDGHDDHRDGGESGDHRGG